MPVRSHHPAAPAGTHPCALVEDARATDVLARLPADLEAHARIHTAFIRRRGLACASDRLRALPAFVLTDHATRSLGDWLHRRRRPSGQRMAV